MANTLRLRLSAPIEARRSRRETIPFGHGKLRARAAPVAVDRDRSRARDHLPRLPCARTGDDRTGHGLRQAPSIPRNPRSEPIDTTAGLEPEHGDISVLTFETGD